MAKTEVTPQLRQRAKNMHDSGLKYKEIAAELKLASEKVAWHLVNTAPKDGAKATRKAPGKAPRPPKAPGKAKPQPKAKKASGTTKASPRTSKKAPAKAPKGDTTRAQAETASTPANLNMVEPAGGGRPVASPPAGAPDFHPVPKPKDRKK